MLIQLVVSLRPTTPAIIRNKNNNRRGDVDSLRNIIPTITVPAAPIAVQQAYAVPKGMPFKEYSRNTILKIKNITVNTDGTIFVKPSENFNGTAQHTSQIPAIIK